METIINFIEEHPRLSNIILIMESLAIIWAAFSYKFTTAL